VFLDQTSSQVTGLFQVRSDSGEDHMCKVYFPKGGPGEHKCNVPIYNVRFIFENIPYSESGALHRFVIDCLWHTLTPCTLGTLNLAGVSNIIILS